MWWRERQVRARMWPLFAWLAWVQPATVVKDPTVEGAALVSDRLTGPGTASHCGGFTIVEGAALFCVCLVGVGPASHSDCGHDR